MKKEKKQQGTVVLIVIIIVLILYSGGITYQHIRGKMIEQQTKEKIDKQLRDHGIDPEDFRFDE